MACRGAKGHRPAADERAIEKDARKRNLRGRKGALRNLRNSHKYKFSQERVTNMAPRK